MLFSIVVGLLISYSQAQTSSCSNERFVEPPKLSQGKFIGILEATCKISGSAGNISGVYKSFRKDIFNDVVTIHLNATNDHSLGLAGEKFDITVKTNEGNIRNLIKIASDQRDRFLYESRSKSIHFSGLSSYLSKLDVVISVNRLANGDVEVKLLNTTNVNKPALAPGRIFLNMATKQAREEFNKQLPRLVKDVIQMME
jgi:hypothetical protein